MNFKSRLIFGSFHNYTLDVTCYFFHIVSHNVFSTGEWKVQIGYYCRLNVNLLSIIRNINKYIFFNYSYYRKLKNSILWFNLEISFFFYAPLKLLNYMTFSFTTIKQKTNIVLYFLMELHRSDKFIYLQNYFSTLTLKLLFNSFGVEFLTILS